MLDGDDGGDADGTIDTPSPSRIFFKHWAPLIHACCSKSELGVAAEKCAVDWHSRTSKEDPPSQATSRPARSHPNPASGSIPRRA
jgi:hypothetical protein